MKKALVAKWKGKLQFETGVKPIRLSIYPEAQSDPGIQDEIDDDMINDLIKSLKEDQAGESFGNLEGLCLSLAYCNQVSPRRIGQVIGDISKNCPELFYLELSFEGYENTSEQFSKGLCKEIGNKLPHLQNLGLFFEDCPNVTADLIQRIVDHILPNLIELERLSLNFNGCKKINAVSAVNLVRAIGQLKKLSTLELYFNECKEMNDDVIKELQAQIESNLKNITSLKLMFSHCIKINENTIIKLGKSIKLNLKNLQELDLGLITVVSSWKTQSALIDSLSHVKKLNITIE